MHRPCTYLILSAFFSPQHFLPTRQKHLSESMHLVSNEVQPSFLNAVINHIPLHGIKSSSRGQPPTQFKHSEHRPHAEFNMRKLSSGESCVAARAPSTARQPWQRLPCGDVAQQTTPMVASSAVRTACFWSPPLSTVFITVAPSHWKYLRVHCELKMKPHFVSNTLKMKPKFGHHQRITYQCLGEVVQNGEISRG